MKKFFLVILIFAICMPLFSLELAAGGGGKIAPYFESLVISAPNMQDANVKNNWADWGVYGFLDAGHLLFEVGYYRAFSASYEWAGWGGPLDFKTQYNNLDISWLDLELFLKFSDYDNNKDLKDAIGMQFGIAWKINLTAKYGYVFKNADDVVIDGVRDNWDQVWFKFGFNYDHNFTQNLFLRLMLNCGFLFETKHWKDAGKVYEKELKQLDISGLSTRFLGFGGDFSVAIGYRFN